MMQQAQNPKEIFISGGTGYIGKRLVKKLLQRGHAVTVLVRKGSEHKVPAGANTVTADPFTPDAFSDHIAAGSTFIQLLGVAHPSPKKAKQFHEIDLRSVKASAEAAAKAGVKHFIYVSVAMTPSRLMAAYQAVRKEGEEYCLQQKLNCTFLRPWYVLGPGHWWPVLVLPFYGLAELVPSWRKQARAKALVTIGQMVKTLINAAENSTPELSILEIKDIRAGKV